MSDPTPATKQDMQLAPAPGGWLGRYPWAVFVVPFVVYMVCNSLEPAPPEPAGPPAPASWLGVTITYDHYPLVYTLKLALTIGAMIAVWPGYRQFPWRVSGLAPLVGLIGAVLWIGLCQPPIQKMLREWFTAVGLGSFVTERSGFNPLEQMSDAPLLAWGFLAVRFSGLVLIVPWIEEFFLRGFLLRFLGGADWPQIPFGTFQSTALALTTLFFAFTHPLTELAAALAWFSLISWLMLRTRNIWDCVVAHAATNLALGIYVVATGAWYLM